MTRVTRRGPKRIDINSINLEQEIYLRSGHNYFNDLLFASTEQMLEAWEMHRDSLKSKWQTEKPGFVSFAEREFDKVQTDHPCRYYY